MSREFGSYHAGYFHTQIETAASDLAGGSDNLSRVWAKWFEAFSPVAYQICNSEAGDSDVDAPILATIAALPSLRAALKAAEDHVRPYDAVAQRAVREALRAQEKDQ